MDQAQVRSQKEGESSSSFNIRVRAFARISDNEINNVELNETFKQKVSSKIEKYVNYFKEINKRDAAFSESIFRFIAKMHGDITENKTSEMQQYKNMAPLVNSFLNSQTHIKKLASDIHINLAGLQDGNRYCSDLLEELRENILSNLHAINETRIDAIISHDKTNQKILEEFLAQIQILNDKRAKNKQMLMHAITIIKEEYEDLAEKISVEAKDYKLEAERSTQVNGSRQIRPPSASMLDHHNENEENSNVKRQLSSINAKNPPSKRQRPL